MAIRHRVFRSRAERRVRLPSEPASSGRGSAHRDTSPHRARVARACAPHLESPSPKHRSVSSLVHARDRRQPKARRRRRNGRPHRVRMQRPRASLSYARAILDRRARRCHERTIAMPRAGRLPVSMRTLPPNTPRRDSTFRPPRFRQLRVRARCTPWPFHAHRPWSQDMPGYANNLPHSTLDGGKIRSNHIAFLPARGRRSRSRRCPSCGSRDTTSSSAR